MSFVNTVDIIGDEALTNSILNGSITEIADNRVTSVGDSAFRGCSALFRADFPSVTGIYNSAFYDCSSLVTLALRSETMCTLYYTSSFDGSPIVNGTGFIYVPAALYDSYLADSKWSTYANQFRKLEDYTVDGTVTGEVDPNRHMVRFFNDDGTFLGYVMVSHGGNAVFDEPVKEGDYAFTGWNPSPTNVTADMDCYAQFRSTNIYTWDAVAASCADGTYKDIYTVGDVVPINLGSYGTYNMEIVAFDADDKADGSGKAAISWVSKELISGYKMNSTDTNNNGWEGSELRGLLQSDFYANLPTNVQTAIVKVNKTYLDSNGGVNTGATPITKVCADNLWIPSYREVFGNSSNDANYETSGADYTVFFKDSTSRSKIYLSGMLMRWHLRSAYYYNNKSFWFVGNNGVGTAQYAATSGGMAFGFCT